jgi:hypothetical protein
MECFNTLHGSLCHICVPYFVMLSTAQLIVHYRCTDAPNVSLCVGHASFTTAPYASDRHEQMQQQYANFHEPPIKRITFY